MGELAKALRKADRRILILDIENSPHVTVQWSLKDPYTPPSNILQDGQVICWAAKWVGESKVLFASDHHEGHQASIEAAYRLVDEADLIIGFNSIRHDLKHLKREFFQMELPPPSPHKDVDLYRVVRQHFAFPSNAMTQITARIGLGKKVAHEGMPLWLACMNGDERAWRTMKRYNVQDVRLTEALYERLLPWIHNHPHVANAAMQGNELTCNKCGSADLERSKVYTAQVLQYQSYRCRRCNGLVRANHRMSRIASTAGVK